MKRTRVLAALALSLAALDGHPRAQQPPWSADTAALRPTAHPRLPADASQLWLAPDPVAGAGQGPSSSPRARTHSAALTQFAEAVKLEVEANYARALPMLTQPALREGPLGDYSIYYTGLAELRLGRAADAKRIFQTLESRAPVGYLTEAAPL